MQVHGNGSIVGTPKNDAEHVWATGALLTIAKDASTALNQHLAAFGPMGKLYWEHLDTLNRAQASLTTLRDAEGV